MGLTERKLCGLWGSETFEFTESAVERAFQGGLITGKLNDSVAVCGAANHGVGGGVLWFGNAGAGVGFVFGLEAKGPECSDKVGIAGTPRKSSVSEAGL